jgi:alginate O-acetyltransferase complex protein AlgI
VLFNSSVFLFVFLPVVLAGFFFLGQRRSELASLWLVGASLFFYGWWSLRLLPLLLVSAAFNYLAGIRLTPRFNPDPASRNRWLAGAIAANLVLLGFFKYANFLVDNVNVVAAQLGAGSLPALNIILPIGISFYTFTQIAFLVDCWQGKVAERNFWHYLLFVSYFPHLVAGPVLHHKQMMPQFAQPSIYRPSWSLIALGLAIFIIGLSKKLLLADPLAAYADPIFAAAHAGSALSLASAWLGVLAYALQIYFDFSGYSDMAIGLSLCFGIWLPINFNSPYKATSIIDFWRRWHITLSTFLRDYLYIPLGGNRLGQARRYLNLMLTMLLGGLWHGASWTFVLWGGAHGLLLAVNHLWHGLQGEGGPPRSGTALGRGLAWALTFVCVLCTWVLFRSPDLATAQRFYAAMAGLGVPSDLAALRVAPALLALTLAVTTLPNSQQLMHYRESTAAILAGPRPALLYSQSGSIALALLLLLCCLLVNEPSPFLYFQF